MPSAEPGMGPPPLPELYSTPVMSRRTASMCAKTDAMTELRKVGERRREARLGRNLFMLAVVSGCVYESGGREVSEKREVKLVKR
mmetsp:Transcript_36241/g.94268  ORF Transcript_36241/g.94268 Transcript_36241/m.94268 type:complete len:85 (-) Transcript_36241:97-351(-)